VRREQTAYDHVIQATSGIMASTGTEEVNPIKIGAPAVDYATGTMGAFALASALFQRERTGKGQHIDLAMLGVAMMLQGSPITNYLRTGNEPKPKGNKQPFATNSAYDAKEGMLMIGASNLRQQERFWRAVERPEMIKTDNEAREDDREREARVIADIIKTKTADEWEAYFQARHVPAARVRTMAEALADPHFNTRRVLHRFDNGAPGIEGSFAVPLAAFKFAHGGPSIETPPPQFGADTDSVLAEIGYSKAEVAALRASRAI
jgi:crotonobetainyl-CoA:carnitine CoA-transferase CaiB-like acyl-CoA transferase